MKKDKLLSNKGSTMRAVSSSVTGVVLNTAFSVACPNFIPAAVISAIQLAVSATNCHRVRKEIKERTASDKTFGIRHRERRNLVNLAIGVTIKAGSTALGAGIIGIDNVADNFVQLAYEVGEHTVHTGLTQHVGDSIGPAAQHLHNRVVDLQMAHSHLFRADQGVHQMFGGIADKVAKALQHATRMQIDSATSCHDIAQLVSYGASEATILVLAATVGVIGEATQFANQIFDILNDKFWSWREERAHSRAERLVEATQNHSKYLTGKALRHRASKQVDVNNQLANSAVEEATTKCR